MHQKPFIETLSDLPTKVERLSIGLNNSECGILAKGSVYTFSYTQDHLLTCLPMKYRPDPFRSGSLHTCFAQSLPEGYVRHYVMERLHRALRDSKVNEMFLLALIGQNGIGALSYDPGFRILTPEPIPLEELLSWSESEPLFPYLLDRFYLSGLASGMQPKVALSARTSHDIQFNRSTGIDGRYIVKSFDAEFPRLASNEFVCMSAAKACGLMPPTFFLSDDKKLFVIERFDLSDRGAYCVEDFLTLTTPTGGDKYKGSCEALLKAVDLYTKSIKQTELAYRYIAFNCLIGNGDAHLKNYALMYHPNSIEDGIKLTPPFDITHTLIYPHLSKTMALKIGGDRAFPSRFTLSKLGQQAGISNTSEIIDELADKTSDSLNSSEECNSWPELSKSIKQSISTAAAVGHGFVQVNRHRRKKYPSI